MPSAEAQAVHEALRNRPSGPPDLAVMREAAEQREALTAEPAVEAEAAPGIDGLWIAPTGAEAGTLLYLHGGGYIMGSPEARRKTAGHLAAAADFSALIPRYRRAPEDPYPAALEDALAAYGWLLDQGHTAERIVIGGDSAGGGLAIAVALRLREDGAPLPAGLLAVSPWLDLTCEREFYEARQHADLAVTTAALKMMAGSYLGGSDPTDPLVSPIYAELLGLPPIFVAVGGDEILLEDALRLAHSAALADVELTLRIDAGMQHNYHVFSGHMPESDAAIAAMGTWLRERVGVA
jgi:monoterpene epsilon-lactone hydrolase